MLKTISAIAVALLFQGPSQAEKNAVMVPVRQFVDGFNKGDTRSALAACAEQTSIIDEFPPHEWHGPGACARWMTDYDTDARKNGITDGIVTLGTPKHLDVAGDRAYVVIPSDYAFKRKGASVKETASAFTFALQKTAAGWRITGWSWANN
jgi:ketosteroid isomerase-like protein